MKITKTSLSAAAVAVLATGTAAIALTSASSSPGNLRNVAADVPPTPPKTSAPPKPQPVKPVPKPHKPRKVVHPTPTKTSKPKPPSKPVICVIKKGGKVEVGAGVGAGVDVGVGGSIGIGIGVTIGPEIRASVEAKVSAHLRAQASAHISKVISIEGIKVCKDVQTWQTASGPVVVSTVPASLRVNAKVNVAVNVTVAAKVFGFAHYSPIIVHGKKALIGEVAGEKAVLLQAKAGAWTLVSCSGQASAQVVGIADVLAQSS